MTDDEVIARVEAQRFMPGWCFSAFRAREGLMLRIEAEVADAKRPYDVTTLRIDSYMPPMRSTLAVDEFVHWRLDRIMLHEVDEWHRVGTMAVSRAEHA